MNLEVLNREENASICSTECVNGSIGFIGFHREVQRKCRGSAEEVQRKCRGSAEEVQRKCRGSAEEVQRKSLLLTKPAPSLLGGLKLQLTLQACSFPMEDRMTV